MGDPDMENRDPNSLNAHVKVVFDEVLGEPDGVRSMDCVWQWSFKCFNGTLGCCYKTLTVLCGIPFAFCWGCSYACTAFLHIWYCTPYLHCYGIELMACKKLVASCLDGFCTPCYESMGYLFSKITVTTKTA